VVYYTSGHEHDVRRDPGVHQAYLLFVYAKDEAGTLTADQKTQLREVVSAIKESYNSRRERS
jgi:hypothetical protein